MSGPHSPLPGPGARSNNSSRSSSNWALPGLNIMTLSGRATSPTPAADLPLHAAAWESTSRSAASSSFPAFSTKNEGFFQRHMRKLSTSLPRFAPVSPNAQHGDKEKLNRGRSRLGRFLSRVPLLSRMWDAVADMSLVNKTRIFVVLLIVAAWIGFYFSPALYQWRKTVGGGEKFVVVLGANIGGGVMEWKGAREWAIERVSIRNKRQYATRWGYNLEIVDMATKKKYAHEWRESWEKVDAIRHAFKKYPNAEWFWWVDLTTMIMEPSYSLQSHLFNKLDHVTYRDINYYNPLNISHPLTDEWLDETSRSAVGDGRVSSINLVLSQDCSGFNLGSFFLRRSAWTERLMDVWWDPVAYEQRHMDWAHKEQDALEALYASQPWVRKNTGFVEQRAINSFPPEACGEHGFNPKFHYFSRDRDFLVNMAGCEWGRDCWGEMYNHRELSYYLNRNPWERFKEDIVAVIWLKLTGQRVKL